MTLEEQARNLYDDLIDDNGPVDEETVAVILLALRAAEQRGIGRAKQACREQIKIFGSSKYAVNQPMSSMAERFGCGQCIEAIHALADKPMEAE